MTHSNVSALQELAVFERALLARLAEVESRLGKELVETRARAAAILADADTRIRDEVARLRMAADEEGAREAEAILRSTNETVETFRAELETRVADFVNTAMAWILPSCGEDQA